MKRARRRALFLVRRIFPVHNLRCLLAAGGPDKRLAETFILQALCRRSSRMSPRLKSAMLQAAREAAKPTTRSLFPAA